MSNDLEISVFDSTSLLIVDKGFVRRCRNEPTSYIVSKEVFAESSTQNYSFKFGIQLFTINSFKIKIENNGRNLSNEDVALFHVNQTFYDLRHLDFDMQSDLQTVDRAIPQNSILIQSDGSTRFILRFKNGIMFVDDQDLFKDGQRTKEKFALNHIPKRATQCYEAGIGLDYSIMVSGKELKASKYVLAQVSPVFEAMFTNDWKDSRNNSLDIEDFEYPEVNALVRLIHGLEFIPSTIDLTIKLMLVADKYEVLELRDQCKEYVLNGLNEDNVMDVLMVAHQLGLDDIQQKALHLITSQKLNGDKLFDGRTFQHDLWALISKAIYQKLGEK